MTKTEIEAKLDKAISKIICELKPDDIPILAECLLDMSDAIKDMIVQLAKKKGLASVAGIDIANE